MKNIEDSMKLERQKKLGETWQDWLSSDSREKRQRKRERQKENVSGHFVFLYCVNRDNYFAVKEEAAKKEDKAKN